jgi:uncharacterized DUF497 family protein
VIKVKKLIWDTWNLHHISRHHVTQEEVEDICHGSPLVLQGQQKSRLLLVGRTAEDRLVSVVLHSQGQDIYYPITAYDSDPTDIIIFKRLRGGDNNEKNEE